MADDGSERDSPPSDARLASLEERLKRAQTAEAERTGTHGGHTDANYREGSRVLSYLLGGPLGGALVGWVLDRMLGTFPWIMLAMLFLGMAAGFRSIMKISTKRPD
jgi:ATP synthase protein I